MVNKSKLCDMSRSEPDWQTIVKNLWGSLHYKFEELYCLFGDGFEHDKAMSDAEKTGPEIYPQINCATIRNT